MTLDAYDWAWRHARSRGNARLVVLAVADKITGPDATARLGLTEARQRLGGVGKGVAVKAIADALAAGDLEIHEPAKGSRPALYRIPGAVNHTAVSGPDHGPVSVATGPDHGPLTAPSGLESGPLATPDNTYRSGIRTTSDLRSGSRTTNPTATGPESGPQTLWDEHPETCATRAQASFKALDRESEGVGEGPTAPASPSDPIPPFARPLVDRITAAKVYVGWDLTANEWLRLDAMLKRSGADMLAEHAVTIAARQRVSSARYFLRAWTSLPPAPTAGTVPAAPTGPGADVIPLNPSAPRKSRAAQSADHLAAALARMEAQQ